MTKALVLLLFYIVIATTLAFQFGVSVTTDFLSLQEPAASEQLDSGRKVKMINDGFVHFVIISVLNFCMGMLFLYLCHKRPKSFTAI